MRSFSKKDFSFVVPPDLIATHPSDKRDGSRLLVLERGTGRISHNPFTAITTFFKEGDVLVFNNSKVFPCRLVTRRKSGGRQEILLIRQLSEETPSHENKKSQQWQVMINASRKVRAGDNFSFVGLKLTIQENEGNMRTAVLEYAGDLWEILKNCAEVPLPPYINRGTEESDTERYQTVFAKQTGSVAAPTAGLHFTAELIERIKGIGVLCAEVTLHVGPGTFLPVKSEWIEDHRMHSEIYSIDVDCCRIINQAKTEGRSVTAVGTTSLRVLETLGQNDGPLKPQTGTTDLFIYPPYRFKIVDRLLTNFHLPESTLLMLVSAFASREAIFSAYTEALAKKYRLFSYGDAMLIC